MEKKFEVEIIEKSQENLTAREVLAFKSTDTMTPLDTLEDGTHIDVCSYVKLDVVNEYSEDKRYNVYALKTVDGEYYSTSSDTFYRKLTDIFAACLDEPDEFTADGVFAVPIKIVRKESNNFKGRFMLMCSID